MVADAVSATPSAAVARPRIRIQGAVKSFLGRVVVDVDDVVIGDRPIEGLIGPNGAGKTTTFNLVSGMFTPDAGSVTLHGKAIHGLPTHRICQQGLARSFQITNLFKGLSIYENLRLSLQARHAARFDFWRDVDDYPDIHAETVELMKFAGLEGIENTLGGDLSYGGQRLVDLGIALGSKPQVLLMDEPLAGLAAAERERVSRLVTTIARQIPVLIVEHDIDRVLSLSQRVTVMNQGEVLMCGSPDEVRADRRGAAGQHALVHPAPQAQAPAEAPPQFGLLRVQGRLALAKRRHELQCTG